MDPNEIKAWASVVGGPLAGLPDVKQETEYTCGPATLLIALKWYGRDQVDEATLARMLATTPSDGTTIGEMVRVSRSFGLDVELREGMSVVDLRGAVDRGDIVIVILQAWADHALPDGGYAGVWDQAHYVIPIAIDATSVLFEDPAVDGSRVYLTMDEFMSRWHSADENKGKLQSAGIVFHGNVGMIASRKPPLGTPVVMR